MLQDTLIVGILKRYLDTSFDFFACIYSCKMIPKAKDVRYVQSQDMQKTTEK